MFNDFIMYMQGIQVLLQFYSREQLLHKLKLEEKEHEEKLTRERAAKVAELYVSTAAYNYSQLIVVKFTH